VAEGQRKGAEERGHGGHEDGPEAQQAGFVDGIQRREILFALQLNGKIDHENGVFLDDADQKDDADQGDQVQVGSGDFDSEYRADACRRDSGENRNGVDEAFVEDAENNVNRNESGDDEE